jgi:hypothetical protein
MTRLSKLSLCLVPLALCVTPQFANAMPPGEMADHAMADKPMGDHAMPEHKMSKADMRMMKRCKAMKPAVAVKNAKCTKLMMHNAGDHMM